MANFTGKQSVSLVIFLILFCTICKSHVIEKRQTNTWDWGQFGAQVHAAAHNLRDKVHAQYHNAKDTIFKGVNKVQQEANKVSFQQAIDSATNRWKDLTEIFDRVNTGITEAGDYIDDD